MIFMLQEKKSGSKNSLCDLKYCFVFLLFISGYAVAETISPQQPLNNCDTVGVDYLDNPEMTRSEKLALMEQAFYASLLKFEDCNLSSSSSSKSASSNSSASASTSTSDGGTSVSSEALQGTEPEMVEESPSSSNNTANEMEAGPGEVGPTNNTNNGRVPEDIPAAENDDVLAAQIRIAAEAETDPETRKKLWNEYRKYKGMNIEQ
jgi:hypothetical protein